MTQGYRPSPEAVAALQRTQRLFTIELSQLKRRRRQDGTVIVDTITKSHAIRRAYAQAVAEGDRAMVEALVGGAAGLFSGWWEQGKHQSGPMLATLRRIGMKPEYAEWTAAILEAMQRVGLVSEPASGLEEDYGRPHSPNCRRDELGRFDKARCARCRELGATG